MRFRAKLAGTHAPTGPATDRVLAGFRREGRTRGHGQVAGIRWEQADAAAAVAANGGGSVAGLRDAAVVALMSDAMLRVSECAALDVQDLATEADGSGRLAIRHSKTDQEGEGALQFVGEPTVRRVRAWLEAAGIEAGAMFRAVRRGGYVQEARITARALRTIVARRAADAGVEGRVSGRSLRVGSAQSLAAAGAGVVEMQVAGRWKSERQPGPLRSSAACRPRRRGTTALRRMTWKGGREPPDSPTQSRSEAAGESAQADHHSLSGALHPSFKQKNKLSCDFMNVFIFSSRAHPFLITRMPWSSNSSLSQYGNGPFSFPITAMRIFAGTCFSSFFLSTRWATKLSTNVCAASKYDFTTVSHSLGTCAIAALPASTIVSARINLFMLNPPV